MRRRCAAPMPSTQPGNTRRTTRTRRSSPRQSSCGRDLARQKDALEGARRTTERELRDLQARLRELTAEHQGLYERHQGLIDRLASLAPERWLAEHRAGLQQRIANRFPMDAHQRRLAERLAQIGSREAGYRSQHGLRRPFTPADQERYAVINFHYRRANRALFRENWAQVIGVPMLPPRPPARHIAPEVVADLLAEVIVESAPAPAEDKIEAVLVAAASRTAEALAPQLLAEQLRVLRGEAAESPALVLERAHIEAVFRQTACAMMWALKLNDAAGYDRISRTLQADEALRELIGVHGDADEDNDYARR